jgi:hypothetical protein
MRILSAIQAKIDSLFRVAVAESDDLRLRAVKQQEILDQLRLSPQFGVLLDQFDGEIRVLFRHFCSAASPDEALETWREAKAFLKLQNRMEMGVTAKSRGLALEEAYIRRQTELLKVDQLHGKQNVEAQARQGQNGRHA